MVKRTGKFQSLDWLCVVSGSDKLLNLELFPMLLSMPEFILRLLVQPTFCRGIKRDRKPNSHFGTNTSPAIQHGGLAIPWLLPRP